MALLETPPLTFYFKKKRKQKKSYFEFLEFLRTKNFKNNYLNKALFILYDLGGSLGALHVICSPFHTFSFLLLLLESLWMSY